jgi:hypothetical protein
LLDRNFFLRPSPQLPTDPRIQAFGIFANYEPIDVVLLASYERHQTLGQRHDRAHIRVQIEPRTQTEEDLPRMLVTWDARISERPEQHRRARASNFLEQRRLEADPLAQKSLGPKLERP